MDRKSNFINKATRVHKNKYSYSLVEYLGSRIKVKILCPIHGVFEQTPRNHAFGQGCYWCGRENTADQTRSSLENFILSANEANNYLYDYSKTVYTSRNHHVIVTCKTHGDFSVSANHHLNGVGCQKCKFRGHSKEGFIKSCKNNNKDICTFYVVHVYNKKESFIKVGITSNSLKERFRKLKTMSGYTYNILFELRDTPGKVWGIEDLVKESIKKDRYEPNIYFVGHSESFLTTCIPNIKSTVKNLGYDIKRNETIT